MVHISQYTDALEMAIDDLPEKHTGLIEKITDQIWDEVQNKLRDHTTQYLLDIVKDDLQQKAAEMAESMLRNAIAGKDRAIRNLFDFNDYYMKNLYVGKPPTQWKLLDTIIERHSNVFIDEKIKQQKTEIENLKRENLRLTKYLDKINE